MEKLNLKTISDRLKAETPSFFKKLRWLMVSCGGLGAALVAVPAEYTVWLPTNTEGMLITVGAVGTFLTSLTYKQPE